MVAKYFWFLILYISFAKALRSANDRTSHSAKTLPNAIIKRSLNNRWNLNNFAYFKIFTLNIYFALKFSEWMQLKKFYLIFCCFFKHDWHNVTLICFYHERIAKFLFKIMLLILLFAKVLRQAQYKLFTQLCLVLSFAERSAFANEKYAQLGQKDFAFFALNIVSFVKNISAIRV